ncbi:30S ribosomal protein S3 [Candidatus Uhrbacteria bacterium CG_4_10_14_0_2_um_filter_41_7]|uniref:Small ribosomal subunit protein uS3 n=1 Tax=Candidatus Uhrbacteria bacterium CG_4_9_14_3_um_filter_41_35 TaxID=1975034 RepID=A0A2M7XG37_9BACT|nr:MAG: 30S ribosomal protein S3 [Candidatus Uhrbacteria bacterium CG11_big_fil_rev_8_21_14_0_20_41_9]PIZ53057.1 MAG: 30S ribosomal protein S3 [Candidatus Uhrbacteria bacterium CG_4_10_14_0_2_um_filter_41_7]PJA46837.1 MAG: 30S ribosomal protein S3 [Candidatus Uhrbacteria bacterium CG_4_9_14_3_um_filter_41_35]
MGQKIHPKLFRLNTIYTWDSKWFASRKNYVSSLKEDVQIREYLKTTLKDASVDSIIIDRNSNKLSITITSAKPGFIIGRAGAGIEELKTKIQKEFFRGRRVTINLNIQEIAQPALSASVVGQQIAQEVEKRMPFRRSMKMARERVIKAGAKGVKITVCGRLNGAEIARTETISEGSIPLHNLRADVDFARITARTIWGAIGVRVWIYKGEVFEGEAVSNVKKIEKPRRRER